VPQVIGLGGLRNPQLAIPQLFADDVVDRAGAAPIGKSGPRAGDAGSAAAAAS
jgi:hypothetical protein